MRTRKLTLLLLSLLLISVLCSCGKDEAALPETRFSVSLQTTANTGYYWDCVLSEEDIVAVESTQDIPDDLSVGETITTTFFFTGKKHGTVTAVFYCRQSWDDSVSYQQTCDIEVDWDKIVTGELSGQTATVRPGDKPYKLSASDSSIALWSSDDDISFTFTPLRSGFTTLTFTPLDDPVAPVRFFYLRAADDNTLTITEQEAPINSGFYSSLEDLESQVGFPMRVPASATLHEISSAGGLAYVNFSWKQTQIAYVGGELDLDAFRTPDAEIVTVDKCEVILPDSSSSIAAWEANGHVFYISCDESIPRTELLTILNEILPA